MEDAKKYYWIKLMTNFFSREDIDFMLSQKNGAEYVVLYQMLCLNTANSSGRLESRIGEMLVPYDTEKIVRDCKYFDIDTVNIAMTLYKKLGLIYEHEDGALKIANYEDMVGCESKWAEKKRLYREKQKLLKENINSLDNVVDKKKDIVRQDYRDKSIEYRVIDNKILNSVSVSVSEAELLSFFENFEIKSVEDRNIIIEYLNNGMEFEVIKNGLLIPFKRNTMYFDFEDETTPINNPLEYGLKILFNWNEMGVKTMEDAKKYNKLNKNKSR